MSSATTALAEAQALRALLDGSLAKRGGDAYGHLRAALDRIERTLAAIARNEARAP